MFSKDTSVLIVDDMPTMRKIVSKICREIGFEKLQEASDGAKAWEIIKSSQPAIELIISDWNMPHASGLDLVKRIRSDQRFHRIPFILLTAEAEQDEISESAKSGVDQHITKPFDKEILKAKLEIVYKKYHG